MLGGIMFKKKIEGESHRGLEASPFISRPQMPIAKRPDGATSPVTAAAHDPITFAAGGHHRDVPL
jgi:hypothetical protein